MSFAALIGDPGSLPKVTYRSGKQASIEDLGSFKVTVTARGLKRRAADTICHPGEDEHEAGHPGEAMDHRGGTRTRY